MTNAEQILTALDATLTTRVELTLYGRAALLLGYEDPPAEYALSQDVDAVMWMGQAEELCATTDFWDAVERVNAELAHDGLYISHFFTEDQVALRPNWRDCRVAVKKTWPRLNLTRLGDLDLLLSKLMRDDPVDAADAQFIVKSGGLGRSDIERAIAAVRLPASSEVREEFRRASARLLSLWP